MRKNSEQDLSESGRNKREKKGNAWALMELEEKRVFVLETTSNFVCTESVSMQHYLETTFLEEADVSLEHQEGETVKSMERSLATFFHFFKTFREDESVYLVPSL